MGQTIDIIKKYRINLRYLASALKTSESVLRFHLRREKKGLMNAGIRAEVRRALRDHAAGILNDLETG